MKMQKYGMMMGGGVLALVALKFLAAFVLPALAVLFGLVMTVAKFAMIAAVIYFVFTMFRSRKSRSAEA